MASIKVILRIQKKNSRGESPLYLRIISQRKASFMSLKIYILEKDWDAAVGKVKKSHSNSARLNAVIAKKISDAQVEIAVLESKDRYLSSKSLKEKMIGNKPLDIFEYSKPYLEKLKKKEQIGSYIRAKSILEKLSKYCDSKPLYINEIDHNFLETYEEHLKSEYENSVNTIHSNMRVIRTILNLAINDGLISRDDYPFNKYKLKLEQTKRDYLLQDELESIEALDLSGKKIHDDCRNIFVFACYTGGMRISDILLLRWENIKDGRVLINTRKTGTLQQVKLTDKANGILEIYVPKEGGDSIFVFPFVKGEADVSTPEKLHKTISRQTARINKHLKTIVEKTSIGKKVSFHVSRHTFATLALRKGMRIEYVSKLLGHTDIQETQVYAKIVDKELDEAMEVFDS